MGQIHTAGISIPAPDDVALDIYARARALVDAGKVETISIDLPNGGGAAFLVGHNLPLAVTTEGPIDAASFEARGIKSATIGI